MKCLLLAALKVCKFKFHYYLISQPSKQLVSLVYQCSSRVIVTRSSCAHFNCLWWRDCKMGVTSEGTTQTVNKHATSEAFQLLPALVF